MANEHIGRLQAIGLGKEATSGTEVVASVWFPKMDASFKPVVEKATNDAAYGVIDEIADIQTVKNMSELTMEGTASDNIMGHLLIGALGKSTLVQCATITGASGGTPARGDSVSSATGTFTGTIKKIILIGTTSYHFIEILTGSSSNQSDLTNGTWTGGTVDFTTFAAVKGHFFERLNTNAHPSFTAYGSDSVSAEKATYSMVESFDLESSTGDFVKFNVTMKGQQFETAAAQTPSYSEDNSFLAKYATVKFADNEAALNAASASDLQRFKLTVAKNLIDVPVLGSVDVKSIHNQQFGIAGDFEAVYDSVTFRDYVENSTKKAARFAFVNSEATAIYDATDDIFPSLYIDMARLSFSEWDRSAGNNDLVTQSMGYTGEFKTDDSMTIEILLLNTNATGY